MTNRAETNYTSRIKNNFFTLTIPRHIRGTQETVNNDIEHQDLADRRRQRQALLKTRGETSAAYNQAQDELNDFQRKVAEYQKANNIKSPSSNDRAVIASVKQSVSSIRLTGPSHGVSDIDRQIAAHAVVLAKRRDETQQAWNEAGKVCTQTFWFVRIIILIFRNLTTPKRSSKIWRIVYKWAAMEAMLFLAVECVVYLVLAEPVP